MTFSLQTFDLHDMLRCGREIRNAVRSGGSVEKAAEQVVRYVYDHAVDPAKGTPECALVRFYKTCSYRSLKPDLQRFAARSMGDGDISPEMQCLILMATAGELPEWNDRRSSRGHQAIPLPSEEIVARAPMIAGLIRGMGIELSSVVSPERAVAAGTQGKTYNVFYVPEARGSQLIPAQDEFVVPHGIRSVVGFGGQLFSGDLYSVILFARVPVPRSSADRFRNIALDLKVSLSTYTESQVFPADEPGPTAST